MFPSQTISTTISCPPRPVAGCGVRERAQKSEWFCWCIGLQVLVLSFALVGRSVHRDWVAAARPAEAPETSVVEITEFAPENTSPAESTAVSPEMADESSPVADPFPEAAEAVAVAEPIPMPPPIGAILEAMPEPILPVAQPDVPRPAPPAATPARRREAVASSGAATPAAPATGRESARAGASGTAEPGPARLFTGGGTGRFPLPPYPAEAKRRGQEGRVMLRVEVGPDGAPTTPSIESGSGHASLDRAAVEWIKRRWRWESGPPRLFRIPIIFRLQ